MNETASNLDARSTVLTQSDQALRGILKSCKFNFDQIPKPSVPRYSIGSIPISTAGNISTISAAVKSGKSSFIGAMLGAAMSGGGELCLSIYSENEARGAIIHLDTEQSREDYDNLVRVALRRAQIEKPPNWLNSYCFTGIAMDCALWVIKLLLADAMIEHGGIHSVLLDGAADFINDVNDSKESNLFVSELHALAIKYHCSIFCVIHVNPNSDKTRGHLGSQLERKSESNIRLERVGDAIVAYAEKNRKAPIPKSIGPRFIYSILDKMHILVASLKSLKDSANNDELAKLAKTIFADRETMKYNEIESALKALGKSRADSQRKIKQMVSLAIIVKAAGGSYELSKPALTE